LPEIDAGTAFALLVVGVALVLPEPPFKGAPTGMAQSCPGCPWGGFTAPPLLLELVVVVEVGATFCKACFFCSRVASWVVAGAFSSIFFSSLQDIKRGSAANIGIKNDFGINFEIVIKNIFECGW
jgi:uncharacterized membrane protein YphA (DoxX/SURF4 family)